MPKKLISFGVKCAVTIGLFVLLFRPETYGLRYDLFGDITPMSLWKELRGVSLGNIVFWLGFATIVKLAGMLCGVLRWRLLLQGQGLSIPFWYMVQSWFVGRFIGIFLPGTLGLDGYRLYDSSMYTREVIKSTTVIAVEKLIGVISLTLLLFITFPLGFRLLKINVAVFSVMMLVFGAFVVVSFLLLLNPRVIQVLVAVIPTPEKVRSKFDKLGAAVTAYSGQRPLLLGAVAFGLLVHLGTCFMYFGTMMAIRAENTSLFDILFASPVMIWGTVIGPSVGGEGIREIVFASLLGSKSGVATSVLFAHLGWWIGELIPAIIGAPIFALRSRPSKEEVQAKLAEARQQSAQVDGSLHLTPDAVRSYRMALIGCVVAGLLGGLIAGGFVGLAEAGWLKTQIQGLGELAMFWWGPLVYGMCFAGIGLGLAGALAFLYLLWDRFAPVAVTFALCLGGSLTAGGGVFAVWRYMRDVLHGHTPGVGQLLTIGAMVLAAGILVASIGAVIAYVLSRRRLAAVAAALLFFALLVAGGAGYAKMNAPAPKGAAFAPSVKSTGPNIVLIVADALRADYLKLHCDTAVAETPRLDTFARDSVFFENGFAQASWTKPSFATIFSGAYPSSHTAKTKTDALPGELEVVAEILKDNGYYTKGLANNPNINAAFNFNQGFVDYVDLKPSLYFGATGSASKLAMYGILRQARHILLSRLSKKMVVTDFYQPAEVVTRDALDFVADAERPKDAPFFLFLHYMEPHDPFMDHEQPGVGFARVRMGNPDPDKFLEPMVKAYNSEIEHMDKHLGTLFDGLKDLGLYEDAVVLFTADHGEEFFDHEGWWHGQTLFDELIRTPLIVKLPKNQMAGATNADFARHIDIAPTLAHLAGLEKAGNMPGKSLFTGDGAFTNKDITYVFAENDFENNILEAVRTHRAKVIHANEGNPRNHAPVECYDLTEDPLEKNDLCAGGSDSPYPDLEKLMSEMREFVAGNAAEPVMVDSISDEMKQQLEGLGYLE